MDNIIEYKFIYFNDKKKQLKFILHNYVQILNMMMTCFPFNNLKHKTELYEEYHKEMDTYLREKAKNLKWFFVTNITVDIIIGFCCLKKIQELINYKDKLETYKLINVKDVNFADIFRTTIEKPCIETLCKNFQYKNVGKFLLEELCEYLKPNYKIIYLVPESLCKQTCNSYTNDLTENEYYE